MKKEIRSRVIKMLLIASVLLLMLTLCGCRTRITNNDEVSNVMYDEEGWMQDDYDTRRDDLGLSKAQKPLFTGFGSPEEEEYEDEYYSDDEQMLDDYEPEEDIEDDTEEPETKPKSTATNSGTTRPGTSSSVVRRKPVQKPATTDTAIQVVLDAGANGGTISGKDTFTVNVKKGDTYSVLFDPDDRDGYTFKGWYTKKSGGTKVTTETKVSVDKKHKLYAQWKKSKKKKTEPEKEEPKEEEPKKEEPEKIEEKKSYDITFDTNPQGDEEVVFSGDKKITVSEDGTYPSLPTAKCTGYTFKGWYTADGTEIKAGDAVKITESQTLTAQWDKNPQEYWDNELALSVPENDADKVTYTIVGDSDGDTFLKKSGMAKGSSDDAEYLVFFGSMSDASGVDNPDGKPILVIPKEAIKNSTKESVITAYRIKVFTKVYDTASLDVDKAAEELGVSPSDLEKIDII